MPANTICKLMAVPGLTGPEVGRWLELYDRDELVQLPAAQLLALGWTPGQIAVLSSIKPARLQLAESWLAQSDAHHLVLYSDPDYPELLRQTKNPPYLLFVQGDKALLDQAQIAIVGSRHPSATAKQIARQFGAELAALGLIVTSGMAQGIDGCSHQGALAGGGKTLAVLGSGLQHIYPKHHQALAEQIAAQGALISEYWPDTPPKAEHFPLRNRIVVGMSLGTLVVEAAEKSGSLISAKLAADEGRELFAVPGSIYNPQAAGCHQLIQQGAKLTTCVKDILEEWSFLQKPGLTLQKDSKKNAQTGLFDSAMLANVGDEATAIDTIAERCGLPVAQVSIELLQLELAGEVAAVPGGYIRVRRA
ncbi:DNA-processing protein DprA [Rheinheimera sp.]|uniref:DNA-processing protein DprA n=1 Tax=Rheinheimera sp. TaxID=1869214 RepID=UPI003AF845F4